MADQGQDMAALLQQQQQTIANLTAQLNQLANQIQAQQNQAPPAQVAPPVTFAVTPGQHAVDQIIDYATKSGAALYEAGSKTLTTKFDMKPESTLVFITELKHRAREAGWDQGVHQIMQFEENGINKKLLTQYGQIAVATLENACESWQQGGDKASSRSTQNNEQMQKCIMNTLTEQARLCVMPFQKEHH